MCDMALPDGKQEWLAIIACPDTYRTGAINCREVALLAGRILIRREHSDLTDWVIVEGLQLAHRKT